MPLRLTRHADSDIFGILRYTLTTFGEIQARDYAALLQQALHLIEEEPDRVSVRQRDDIREGICSFHVGLAASRRGAAAHQVYFCLQRRADELPEIVVLRVLHERMEPRRHVLRATMEEG